MPADTNIIIEDVKAALVCDDGTERQKTLEGALKELGYQVQIAASPEDMYDRVKYNHYEVIFLHDTFGGGNSENNEVLDFIQSMPIAARRKIMVALAGGSYTTLDHMAAFTQSVDIVMNEADIPEAKAVLKKSITSNYMFYKVYNEILRDSGKA
jgi:CheY-like chemotaxis protein